MAATKSIGKILAAVAFSEHVEAVLGAAVDFARTLALT